MRQQGITFGFLNNPIQGDRISVQPKINGIPIIYNNGLDIIDFEFTNNDSEILADPFHRVKIGDDSSETRNNLILFFQNNGYQSTSTPITLEPTTASIESLKMYFNASSTIYFLDLITNDNVIMSFFDIDVENTLNLKYFLEYTNKDNDFYRCEILQLGFAELPKEIIGRITLLKGEAKDHLNIIRGTGVNLKLQANQGLTFEDLYSGTENDFRVRVFRNYQVIFEGFLKPDGVVQSYTRNIWDISIDCVDGLGFLNDLSFTKTNGLQFTGKMSHLDIIYNCLTKTGLALNLNTYVNIEYENMGGSGLSRSVLSEAYLSVERFIKSDDNTIMSCAEVLSSVLSIYSAVITQHNGQWFVYRPNDLFLDEYPIVKTYSSSNAFINTFNFPKKSLIGSHIDKIKPFHCNGNQQISIVGAVSAFRLGYKYGFIGSLMGNGNLKHDPGTKIYDKWTVHTWNENKNSGYLVIDPVSDTGISFKAAIADIGETRERRDAITSVLSDELLEGYSVDFKTRFKSYGYPVTIEFYVYLFPTDGSDPYTMNLDGSWNSPNNYTLPFLNADQVPNGTGELTNFTYERSFALSSLPLPKSGKLQIGMYVPFKAWGSPTVLVDVKSMELINTFAGNNIVGEFHTVSRSVSVSSIVKESKSVSIGDNETTVYQGAIYKGDTSNLTDVWFRIGKTESKPILRIAAEDNLRIAQRPLKLFSGSFYGYSPYLSVYSINKISGKFMPISYSFDTFQNIVNVRLLELHSPELNSIDYIKTEDYGETVKPTIV